MQDRASSSCLSWLNIYYEKSLTLKSKRCSKTIPMCMSNNQLLLTYYTFCIDILYSGNETMKQFIQVLLLHSVI